MAEKYEYLDKEGLSRFYGKIKELYATKASVEDINSALRQLILDEQTRAEGIEGPLRTELDAEVTRATNKENEIRSEALNDRIRIEGKFDSAIGTSRTEEQDLHAKDTELASSISTTESTLRGLITSGDVTLDNKIDTVNNTLNARITSIDGNQLYGVKVNGTIVDVENHIANIRLSDFNPNVSIIVGNYPFSTPGDNSKLYIDESTSVIWQWDANNNQYIEAGKYNVLEVEDEDHLPEIGDSEVLYISKDDRSIYMWIWDGDEEHTDFEDKWQEISGQDKALRQEFEEYKNHHHSISDIDDASDLHIGWLNIENRPQSYPPSAHAHDDLYYTKGEVDDRILSGAITHQDLTNHENNAHPHPTLEASINESLSQKASLALLGSHTTARNNPHEVSAGDLHLENVDNTHDLDKPISTATQAALDTKANISDVNEALDEKVSFEDVVDNLITSQSEKPLSANQGVILDGKISEMTSMVSSLGAVLRFKGTVASYDELINISEPEVGDAYQINSGENKDSDGEMFAYNGVFKPIPTPEEPEEDTEGDESEEESEEEEPVIDPENYGWVRVIASVTDISQWAATLAEVHKIIDFYR